MISPIKIMHFDIAIVLLKHERNVFLSTSVFFVGKCFL